MTRSPTPNVSGTNGGHSLGIHLLGNRGANLLGRLRALDGTRLNFADDVQQNLAFETESAATIRRGIETYIEEADIPAEPFAPDEADELYVATSTPTELDVARDGIGAVIWATGFTGDYSWLDVPGVSLDARGLISTVDGVSPVLGLFVLGSPWLIDRSSGILLGVGKDAEWIADRIAVRRGSPR